MASGNSRRTQANLAWLSTSAAFVAMIAVAYGSGAMRDANGEAPPWLALSAVMLVAVAAIRWYFLSSLDPDGKPPLRARLAAGMLPLAGGAAVLLSILLAAKSVYVMIATGSLDARNGWRIGEAVLFAALAACAWRRWKRRRR